MFPCWNCWRSLTLLVHVLGGYASGIVWFLARGAAHVAYALAWNLTVVLGTVNRMTGNSLESS